MTPSLGDGGKVEIELFLGGKEFETLGIGFHEGVLHRVVDHFDVVARAVGTEVGVADSLTGGEGTKSGFEAFHCLIGAAHHEAEAVGQAPDAAADAHVNESMPRSASSRPRRMESL